jgi:hypothetical protein
MYRPRWQYCQNSSLNSLGVSSSRGCCWSKWPRMRQIVHLECNCGQHSTLCSCHNSLVVWNRTWDHRCWTLWCFVLVVPAIVTVLDHDNRPVWYTENFMPGWGQLSWPPNCLSTALAFLESRTVEILDICCTRTPNERTIWFGVEVILISPDWGKPVISGRAFWFFCTDKNQSHPEKWEHRHLTLAPCCKQIKASMRKQKILNPV